MRESVQACHQIVSLLSLPVPVCRRYSLLMGKGGRGGRGAESYDRKKAWAHRLNMEVDLQSLFGLHVT